MDSVTSGLQGVGGILDNEEHVHNLKGTLGRLSNMGVKLKKPLVEFFAFAMDRHVIYPSLRLKVQAIQQVSVSEIYRTEFLFGFSQLLL